MKGTVYIRLRSDGQCEWLTDGEDAASGRGTPEEASAARAGRRSVVLVPGADVLLTAASVPTRKRQRILQALPYALEEQLAADPEALHFAIGPSGEEGTVVAAVVARERMDQWLTTLREAGIEPDAMMAETSCLPVTAGEWTLLVEEREALLRTGPVTSLAVGTEILQEALQLASAGGVPERLRLIDCRGRRTPLPLLNGIEVVEDHCDDALVFLAGHVGREAIDLLQGDYSRHEAMGRRWRPWRLAAGLAGATLLVQAGLGLAHLQRIEREEAQLRQQTERLYRETFPEARRVVAPRVQMEQQLEALRRGAGSDGFSNLLARVGPTLSRTGGLQLKGLRYRDGTLEIDLSLGSLQALDGLKQELTQGALQVDIASASAQGDRVESRLTISGRGA